MKFHWLGRFHGLKPCSYLQPWTLNQPGSSAQTAKNHLPASQANNEFALKVFPVDANNKVLCLSNSILPVHCNLWFMLQTLFFHIHTSDVRTVCSQIMKLLIECWSHIRLLFYTFKIHRDKLSPLSKQHHLWIATVQMPANIHGKNRIIWMDTKW